MKTFVVKITIVTKKPIKKREHMLNNQTLQTMRTLKLTGMADALEQQLM